MTTPTTYRIEVQRQGRWDTYGGRTGVYERLPRAVAEVRTEYIQRLFRLPCRLIADGGQQEGEDDGPDL